MTKVKTTTIRAKEEEDESLFINGAASLDDGLLGSDGESGEEDERAHSNLMSDISKISKKKKLGAAPRSVRSSTKEGGTLVNAKAILKRLGVTELEKSTKELQRLKKPLEKVVLRRHKRAAGYDKVACESEKWASLVLRRRAMDQVTFPLQEADIRVHNTLKTEEVKMRTSLEQEVYSLLHGAKLVEDKKETNEEIARKRAMSLEELKERNRMAWRQKQLKRKIERKAWQQNKNKSRKYHRLLRRDRLKQQRAELEVLEKTDPEAALEKMEELEKARVHERMTLRHKHSKWARVQGLRASRDEQAKTALKDSQSMHQDLVAKRKVVGDSSDEDEDKLEEKLEALRREKEKAISAGLFDPSNPWTANLFRQIPERVETTPGNAIDDSFVNFKKFWNEVNKRRLIEKKAQEELAKREEEARREERENAKEEEGMEEESNHNDEIEEKGVGETKDSSDLTIESEKNKGDAVSYERDEEEATDEDGEREKGDETEVKPSGENVKKKKKVIKSKKKNLSKVVKSKKNLSTEKLKGKKKLKSDGSKSVEKKTGEKGEESIKKKKKAGKKKIGEKESTVKGAGEKKKNEGKQIDYKEETAKKKKKNKTNSHNETEDKDDGSKKGKKKDLEKKRKLKTQKKKKKMLESDKRSKTDEKEENENEQKVNDSAEEVNGKENIDNDDLEDQLVSIDNLFNQAELKLQKKLKKKLGKLGINDSSDGKWTKVGSKKTKGKEGEGKGTLLKVEEFDFSVKKDQENTDESLERARTMEDMDNLQQKKGESSDPLQKAVKILQAGGEKGDEKTASASGGKTSLKPGKMVQLDPTKFLQVDNKLLQTAMPNTISSGMDGLDDDEDEDDPDDIIRQAFADDYLIDEFQSEKKAAIDKDKQKEVCLVLPGWGDWTGPNITVSKRKRKKFTVRPLPEPPRRDDTMGNVIYNEKADIHDNLRKVLVSELPYPFSRVQDFEASVRAPLGRMFVPEKEHQKLTIPPVITKSGTIIEAMTEEELLKHKNLTDKEERQQQSSKYPINNRKRSSKPPPTNRNKTSKMNSK